MPPRSKRTTAALALVMAAALAGAACSGDGDRAATPSKRPTTTAPSKGPTTTGPTTTGAGPATSTPRPALTAPAGGPGLSGMRGTVTGAKVPDDFAARLRAADPRITDPTHAAEAYDAVVVAALAATDAGGDGTKLAGKVVGVTGGGQKCTTHAECAALLAKGVDIDYDGTSGPIDLAPDGQPTRGTYGIVEFGTTGCQAQKSCLDPAKATHASTSLPPEAVGAATAVTGGRPGDGQLVIGALLPTTGSLAGLGRAQAAGIGLAVADVNAAGGVRGTPVRSVTADSGDTPATATAGADSLLAQSADVVIGAPTTALTEAVIDRVTGAGVTMISPSATGRSVWARPDKGLFFAVAPSDVMQAQVLADTILGEGHSNVYLIARNDTFGSALAEDTQAALETKGATVVGSQLYDPTTTDFSTVVRTAKAGSGDAIVVIGYAETSRLLAQMAAAGIGPDKVSVYGTDANMTDDLAARFDNGS